MPRMAFLLTAAALLAAGAEAREGFGFAKKSVSMIRTRPPALNLPPRRIRVTAASDRQKEADDAATLRRYTEEMILSGAGTLAAGAQPEISIKLAIDRLDSHETWEEKTEYQYRKIGTKQEWNSKKNRYETKDVYDNVPVQKNVKVLTASLSGAFDVMDRSGRVVDSGDLREEFSRKYEDGRNSAPPAGVEDDLLRKAAAKVAARLVPTTDRVAVLVPKGSFEAFIPLAEANVWDRYQAAVEAVPANPRASQEAYRQYALGLAKEGQAYATSDVRRATDLLRQAVGHYQSAAAGNPEETIFRETYDSILSSRIEASLPRATAGLAAYEVWSAGKHPNGQAAPVPRKGGGPMSNETLLAMAQAGLNEENLMLAIDDAPEVAFDASPEALIVLAKGGVSRRVIAHMQKRIRKR